MNHRGGEIRVRAAVRVRVRVRARARVRRIGKQVALHLLATNKIQFRW